MKQTNTLVRYCTFRESINLLSNEARFVLFLLGILHPCTSLCCLLVGSQYALLQLLKLFDHMRIGRSDFSWWHVSKKLPARHGHQPLSRQTAALD